MFPVIAAMSFMKRMGLLPRLNKVKKSISASVFYKALIIRRLGVLMGSGGWGSTSPHFSAMLPRFSMLRCPQVAGQTAPPQLIAAAIRWGQAGCGSRASPTNLLRSLIGAGTMWFESLPYQPAAQFDRGRHHDRCLDI